MSPAFERWLEQLFLKRLQRGDRLKALKEEWAVNGRSVAEEDTDRSLAAMRAFRCSCCALWFYVDSGPAVIALRAEGRICLRCSEIPTPSQRHPQGWS